MRQRYETFIDIAGKIFLVWLVFSTLRYFYNGSFVSEINSISNEFDYGFSWISIYKIVQLPFAAIGIFIIFPLILKGRTLGLILGIFHWILAYPTNPLWFIVPRTYQIGPDGRATLILAIINIIYSVLTLLILIAFYFYRRSITLKRSHNNASSQDSHKAASL